MAIPVQIRIQAVLSQVIYGLPKPLRRLIAGKPVRLDG